jgi:uncharacterized protein (TIGR02996 family)
MKYPGILLGDSPSAMRDEAIRDILLPIADAVFAARKDVNSVILAVAQYWNDEADDAVHETIHYSRRHTPIWPHECAHFAEEPTEPSSADFCRWCGGQMPGHPSNLGWVPWDDNGSAITAFEAYCREGCDQNMSTVEAYLPYAVVRRGSGVEIVGKPVRVWTDRAQPIDCPAPSPELAELLQAVYAAPDEDGPRSVLADYLLEKGDPIGELIALQLRRSKDESQRELLDRHGRSWMGEIDAVVAKSTAVFRRGFLTEAEVLFESSDEIARYGSDPRWGTVEKIHFVHLDHQHVDPAMRALRAVSGLSDRALRAVAEAKHSWPIVDLAARIQERKTIDVLADSTALPRLRRLELGGSGFRMSHVVQLSKRPMAEKLERLAVEGVATSAIAQWIDAVERFTHLAAFEVVQRLDAGRKGGWTFSFERGPDGRLSTLHARLDNLAGDGRVERVCDVMELLPRDQLLHVVLERSELYEPMIEDEARVRKLAESQRRFEGVELR